VASGRRKMSRKELVQQDQITNRLEETVEWVMDHPQPFLWGIAAVIVVAVVATGWTVYATNRNESAQAALGEVIRTYHDTIAYESDTARFQATVNEALEVEASYGGMQAGRIASYYRALAHEELGEVEEATEILESLASSSDRTIGPLAAFALGQAYKSQGAIERAEAIYQDLLESGEYSAPVLLFELAGLSEAGGRIAEAENYYESILSDYPGSVLEADAERALKRLRTSDAEGV
jgi:tetratricopeptide (TPR) repeat protein